MHYHHRKTIIWKTLLASEKLSKPVVDTKTLSNINKESISTTKIFFQWPPSLSAKKSSSLEQGGIWFLFDGEWYNSRPGLEIAGEAPRGLKKVVSKQMSGFFKSESSKPVHIRTYLHETPERPKQTSRIARFPESPETPQREATKSVESQSNRGKSIPSNAYSDLGIARFRIADAVPQHVQIHAPTPSSLTYTNRTPSWKTRRGGPTDGGECKFG